MSYFISDFDPVGGRLHGLIKVCMSDSNAYKVAVPLCVWFNVQIKAS